jgi:hypothetical protein
LGLVAPETKKKSASKLIMKTFTKTLFYAQMAAMLLASAIINTSASQIEVPFRGSLGGDETSDLPFPLFFVDGAGTGNATHLGRFTATWHRQGSLIDGSQTATYQYTAANGDSLFIESVGQADMTLAPNIHVIETGTITGGTGRFAGATGTFTIERVVVITGPDTTFTSDTLEGTIVLNKAN